MIPRQLQCRTALAALVIVLTLLAGCAWPILNSTMLMEMKAEARTLMAAHPAETFVDVPKSEFPPVIASLKPEFVTVYSHGVEITTKPYFDGGWGYFVPRDERVKPEPAGRFSEIIQGVYWFHPY